MKQLEVLERAATVETNFLLLLVGVGLVFLFLVLPVWLDDAPPSKKTAKIAKIISAVLGILALAAILHRIYLYITYGL